MINLKTTEASRINPLATMNVYIQFHGNASKSSWGISVGTKVDQQTNIAISKWEYKEV